MLPATALLPGLTTLASAATTGLGYLGMVAVISNFGGVKSEGENLRGKDDIECSKGINCGSLQEGGAPAQPSTPMPILAEEASSAVSTSIFGRFSNTVSDFSSYLTSSTNIQASGNYSNNSGNNVNGTEGEVQASSAVGAEETLSLQPASTAVAEAGGNIGDVVSSSASNTVANVGAEGKSAQFSGSSANEASAQLTPTSPAVAGENAVGDISSSMNEASAQLTPASPAVAEAGGNIGATLSATTEPAVAQAILVTSAADSRAPLEIILPITTLATLGVTGIAAYVIKNRKSDRDNTNGNDTEANKNDTRDSANLTAQLMNFNHLESMRRGDPRIMMVGGDDLKIAEDNSTSNSNSNSNTPRSDIATHSPTTSPKVIIGATDARPASPSLSRS